MQPLATILTAVPYHAIFSTCERYRYDWYYRRADGPCVVFIGLNPSKANGHRTDATVRRCIAYAKRWGFGAVRIVNLFSWIDTDPAAMKLAAEPVGPRSNRHLMARAAEADLIVAVWGTHGTHLGRDRVVNRILKGRLHALSVNKDGSPSHPLSLPKDLRPFPYA